ncbi:MAG TPA: ABC transporter permease [Actinobacteria bacterium]|nr:ABC transporter permease [Actinomycetota bacterium]
MGKEYTLWSMFWRRFRHHRLALVSLFILIFLSLSVIILPFVLPYDYAEINLKERFQPPSLSHPFGTDDLGRDQLVRVMYGGRISLAVGLIVALFSTLVGVVIGAIAGYFGGILDNILMRLTDFALIIPALVILMVAGSIVAGGVLEIILIISLLMWMYVARLIRGVFLSLKAKEFVEAARACGASHFRIIVKHLLPNAVAPIIVNITLAVGYAILIESALSFLGFGIQPPIPSWGNMLQRAQHTMILYPWLTWFPGAMIVLTVLTVNFLGDGLRDALEPTKVVEV